MSRISFVTVLCFFTVLIGQGILIFQFGVDMPVRDQWDGEYVWYKAMVTHSDIWTTLIAPHNEHRIAATRLFNGAVFLIIGGWRPIVGMYAQAFIIASLVAWLCILIYKYGGRWHLSGIMVTLFAFFGPFSWENILCAFQNQFYFMVLFALISISLVAFYESWLALLMAVFLAALSPFTMAGGLLTPIAFLLVVTLARLANRLSTAKFLTALILTILIVGWHYLHAVHVPDHDSLKAKSIIEFLQAFIKILSWPIFPIGLLIWSMLMFTLFRHIQHVQGVVRWLKAMSSMQIFIIGGLFWISLQIAAIAYARAHGFVLSSRYQQIFALSIPFFFLALASYGLDYSWLRPRWIASVLVVGLAIRSYREWPHLVARQNQMRVAKIEIQKAVQKKDFAYLKAKDTEPFSLGYFNAELIWQRIHDEKLFPYHLWVKNRPNL